MSMSRLEAVLASIDADAGASMNALHQATEFAERTAELRVEGTSGDRLAVAVVDEHGQLVSISFGEAYQQADAAALSAAVMSALGQAQRRLSFRIEQLGREIYGRDSPTASMFATTYRERFGYEDVEVD